MVRPIFFSLEDLYFAWDRAQNGEVSETPAEVKVRRSSSNGRESIYCCPFLIPLSASSSSLLCIDPGPDPCVGMVSQ